MSALAGLNWALLLPVLSFFLLQRVRGTLSVAIFYLSGLSCCLPKRSSKTGFEWIRLEDQNKQDKRLLSLGLCVVALDGSKFKRFILTHQQLFTNYQLLLELATWTVLSQLLTWGYNCFGGDKVTALLTIYSLTPPLVTLLYAVRVPLQVVFLTGQRAIESRVAGFLGFATFATTVCVLRLGLDPLKLGLSELVHDAVLHLQALMLTLSSKPPKLSLGVGTMLVHIVLATLLGALAAGMALPALRFSQTFLTIIVAPKTPAAVKLLTTLDHFWPLATGLLLTGYWSPLGLASSSNNSDVLKLAAIAILIVLRLVSVRWHLQAFLDTVTRSVALVPGGVDVASDPELTKKIEARTDYLAAAATQVLALPVFFLAVLALCLRYSTWFGNSTCAALLAATGGGGGGGGGAGASQLAIAYANLDATSHTAQLAAQSPFWGDVWGVMVHSHRRGGAITLDFVFKLATLFPLPPHVVHGLGLAIVCAAALLWFSISSCAVVYWYAAPEIMGLRIALQTQHPPKPIPGGSRAEREIEAADLAAASAAGGRKEGEPKARGKTDRECQIVDWKHHKIVCKLPMVRAAERYVSE